MDKNFIKERDEALLSLDKNKILQFAKKYEMGLMPVEDNAFWGGIHKAILYINSATHEQKEKSKIWLMNNGYKLEIFS